MRLPSSMGPPSSYRGRQAASAAAGAVVFEPQVASVPCWGCLPVTRRQSFRILRLDHSFRTAGIMVGLKRMLMVRKHSYVQKHFDSRMNFRDASASLENQIFLKS